MAELEGVAQFLLDHGYHLSALELLVEAREAGADDSSGDAPNGLASLEAFFSDPAAFPPESLRKFQSDDERRLQDYAKERERILQVAQYELRIAKEDIVELKGQLRRAAEAPLAASTGPGEEGDAAPQPPPLTGGPGEHEAAVLNGAVRQYLQLRGYKMSAMTLAEECGSAIEAPPAGEEEALRGYYANVGARAELLELQAAHEALQDEAAGLKQRLREEGASHAAREAQLSGDLERAEKAVGLLQGDVGSLKSRLDLALSAAGAGGAVSSLSLSPSPNSASPPPATDNGNSAAAAAGAGAGAGAGGEAAVGSESTVYVVAGALPRVVPSVLIAKRGELLPLFQCAIRQHPDASTRDELTNLLFNLIKRPGPEQREMIMRSCVELASSIGELRTEAELLPQCWEQMGHKHPERRVLVAEACGLLAPHVRPDLRPSLLLSILQQLAGDPEALVRESVAANLARILSAIGDPVDKFPLVNGMMLDLLLDGSDDVSHVAAGRLLPALVGWAKGTDLLLERLMPPLLSRARSLVERSPVVSSVEGVGAAAGLRHVGEHDRWRLDVLLKTFVGLLPQLRQLAGRSGPLAGGGHLSPEAEDAALVEYVCKGAGGAEGWPAVDWVLSGCVPELLWMAAHLAPPGEGREGAEAVRRRVCLALRAVCRTVGEPFSAAVLRPLFGAASGGLWTPSASPEPVRVLCEAALPKSTQAARAAHLCVLPVLLAGVLAGAGPGALQGFLRELIADEAAGGGGTWADLYPGVLGDAVAVAASFEDLHPQLLDSLSQMGASPVGGVRAKAGILVRGLAAYLPPDRMTTKVLPGLERLAADPHVAVRMATIEALGECAARAGGENATIIKIQAMFDHLLEDGSHEVTMAVVKALSAGCRGGHAGFIEFALQRLQHVSLASAQRTGPRRAEAAAGIFDALRIVDTCEIASEKVQLHLLAGLEAVWREESLLPEATRELLAAMVLDHSGRAGRPPPGSLAGAASATSPPPGRGGGGGCGGGGGGSSPPGGGLTGMLGRFRKA